MDISSAYLMAAVCAKLHYVLRAPLVQMVARFVRSREAASLKPIASQLFCCSLRPIEHMFDLTRACYTAKNFTTKSGLRVRGGGCFLTLQVLSLICPPLWCQVLPSQKSIIVVSKTGLGYKAKV